MTSVYIQQGELWQLVEDCISETQYDQQDSVDELRKIPQPDQREALTQEALQSAKERFEKDMLQLEQLASTKKLKKRALNMRNNMKKIDDIAKAPLKWLLDKRIVAMYEPFDSYTGLIDSANNAYRVQVLLRPETDNYDAKMEKKVLRIFKFCLSRGPRFFFIFEQAVISNLLGRLKGKDSKIFTQAEGAQNNIWNVSLDMDVRGKATVYDDMSGRKIITVNKKYDQNHLWGASIENPPKNDWFDLYETFYKSLNQGYGTIGFQDYHTGLTVRGGVTLLRKKTSFFWYANPQMYRFREKIEKLKEYNESVNILLRNGQPS